MEFFWCGSGTFELRERMRLPVRQMLHVGACEALREVSISVGNSMEKKIHTAKENIFAGFNLTIF